MSDQQPDPPKDVSAPHDTGEGIPTIISNPPLAAEKQNIPVTGNVTVGTKLGPYELVRKLGQGGMGAVFEARHHKLGKTFAIKVLPGGFASNQAALTRFEREMQAIGKLDHPHIIKATDADEWQGMHYLVMEYVEGTDLSELVKARGPLSVRDACKAIRQAAMGLEHAHQHGLVHRDIKPSNLFVTKSGQIKLLDLGLARLGDDGEHQRGLTTVGQVLGTPDYMAPEQWDDTHSVDARADLYSLGCTLFFVLTGRAPYADVTKSSLLQLMKAHVEGAIPNLTDVRLDVPAELNAVFVRLLAKNADDRYANAGEVIAALEPFTRKGADTEVLAGKPVFVPGKEPPAAQAVESSSKGLNVREGDLSAQRSIKSLSASSTDDAFGSNRPMIQSDRSASMVETIIQSRPLQPSRGRAPLLIGISLVSMAVLIGLAIQFTSKPATDSTSRETSTAGQSPTDNKNENQTPTGRHGWPADAPPPAIASFNTEQAKQHQEAWAKYLGVPVEYTNALAMKFVLIPPGEFTMGSTAEEIAAAVKEIPPSDINWVYCAKSEAPQHKVILTQPIYLGVNEVTQAEYEKVMGTNTSWFAKTGPEPQCVEKVAGMDTADHPVENVSWNDAAEFCAKLSQQEKLKPFYYRAGEAIAPLDGTGYRLPAEAEWEFACRAGTTTKYWSGNQNDDLVRVGWFGTNSGGRTHAVGELKANPFGLADIHGNVWEWVQDGWDATYYGQYSDKPAIDPHCPFRAGSLRVVRGGDWNLTASRCRSSNRHALDPADRNHGIGFRVSLVVDAVKADLAVRASQLKAAATTWHGWPADAPKPAIAPFNADEARQHQEAWAAYLKVPVEWENSIGMKFRLIPPGEFTMGSTSAEIEEALMFTGEISHWKSCIQSEAPQHTVILTRPFFLGVHEVTQEAYEKVMERNPSHFSAMGTGNGSVGGIDTSRHPVEMVSWIDAAEFCTKLSTQEKSRPFYSVSGVTVTQSEGTGYRLPTEAEWEFACRAGTTTTFWSGNNAQQLASCGWVGSNSRGRTHAVGELKVNPLGLYDVHGNVFEWVQDWWDPAYYSQLEEKPAQNPDGATLSAHRSVRGGGWDHPASRCRSALRLASNPPYREHNLGFRVALTLDAVKTKTAESK